MFGVAASTVAGRLRMIGLSAVGWRMSITAAQHSMLKSSSAVEKVSGLYSKRQSVPGRRAALRSEEHTSALQSLMRISYAVFCLKKKQIKYIVGKHAETLKLIQLQSM